MDDFFSLFGYGILGIACFGLGMYLQSKKKKEEARNK